MTVVDSCRDRPLALPAPKVMTVFGAASSLDARIGYRPDLPPNQLSANSLSYCLQQTLFCLDLGGNLSRKRPKRAGDSLCGNPIIG
jgi:hypothetical protein